MFPHALFAKPEAPENKEGIIVAFGDSLTAGLGVNAHEAYPALLERKIKEMGYTFRVINAGVSGETTAGGVRRIEWVLRNQPDIVILELGANDGLRGLSLQQMKKNLSKIIERLQREKVKILLAGMKIPPNYGKRYTEAFEKIYPTLAQRYQLPLIPFFLEGVASIAELNQADGIHPTANGYRIITEEQVWPILEKMIQQ